MKHQFGSKLKELREKANLTQQQVAKGLGYTTAQFISNFEMGRAAPPIPAIPALAFMYKVKTEVVRDIVFKIITTDVKQRMGKVSLTNKMRSTISSKIH